MPLISTTALCVRRFPYSETSLILWLYTRERGLLKVLAKGAFRTTKAGKSQFDGGIDLLEEGACVVTDRREKDLNLLTEWKLLDSRRSLRRRSRSLMLALYVAELIGQLFEQYSPDASMYDRVIDVLDDLSTDRREEALIAFVIDLLTRQGIPPRLGECVLCERDITFEAVAHFSPSRGGVLCERHAAEVPDAARITPTLLATMLVGSRAESVLDWPRLTRRQADPINRLLMDHIEIQTQHDLRLRGNVVAR